MITTADSSIIITDEKHVLQRYKGQAKFCYSLLIVEAFILIRHYSVENSLSGMNCHCRS
jgi:hypothetical protein